MFGSKKGKKIIKEITFLCLISTYIYIYKKLNIMLTDSLFDLAHPLDLFVHGTSIA